MKKFYVNMAIELRQLVEIEAETLEEAIKQANSYIELGDLNNSDVIESNPVYIEDEHGDIIKEF